MINNITKYKALILAIGMIAGLGIVAQPVLKAYVDCEKICQLEKNADSDQKSDAEEENPNEAQISALEAVAPTAQIHLSPLDFVLEDQPEAEMPETSILAKMAVRLPEKLLKVLFNIIIAPNAP
ncbi:MAG: hypothetical protein ABJE80_12695 [Reichenbachiella sp.]|uniref:hypothetical protein n=1 Tax=Reichenbachiella sp. TaxID=2184521 RepID=UPI003264170E